MKRFTILFALSIVYKCLPAQVLSIAADEMNIFYVGIDNPFTVAVENQSNTSLVVKASNGTIAGSNGIYTIRSNKVGVCSITVYRNEKRILVKLGMRQFRMKALSAPVFKIGSGRSVVSKIELMNQQYVRAEMQNFGICGNFGIDSFSVCIVSSDSCRYVLKKNLGSEIHNDLQQAFSSLQEKDVVIFKNIYAKGLDGSSILLEPVMITIAR
jgi:hypothetical protein